MQPPGRNRRRRAAANGAPDNLRQACTTGPRPGQPRASSPQTVVTSSARRLLQASDPHAGPRRHARCPSDRTDPEAATRGVVEELVALCRHESWLTGGTVEIDELANRRIRSPAGPRTDPSGSPSSSTRLISPTASQHRTSRSPNQPASSPDAPWQASVRARLARRPDSDGAEVTARPTVVGGPRFVVDAVDEHLIVIPTGGPEAPQSPGPTSGVISDDWFERAWRSARTEST